MAMLTPYRKRQHARASAGVLQTERLLTKPDPNQRWIGRLGKSDSSLLLLGRRATGAKPGGQQRLKPPKVRSLAERDGTGR